jgi:hypothetical protein
VGRIPRTRRASDCGPAGATARPYPRLTRINAESRIDVYPGESQLLDLCFRADDDVECYGWNNEAYFSQPLWRNPRWQLPRDRYLVKAVVTSSGQKCTDCFRLVNDGARTDFRLEPATPDERNRCGVRAAGARSPKKRWYEEPTTLFTFMVALFTLALALATYINAWAYIQSERAQLFVRDVRFAHGEPNAAEGGFDVVVVIKNVGRHIATVTDLNVSPVLHIHAKELRETPNYPSQPLIRSAPPIPPDGEVTVNGKLAEFKAMAPDVELLSEPERIKAVLSGEIPTDVYGYISYNNGFSVFGPSVVGYCFHYIPPSTRLPGQSQFQICDNPNYTYAR